MTPEELSATVRTALLAAIDDGLVTLPGAEVPAEVRLERPRQQGHGDWATNIAMQLAKKAGLAPRELAQILAARIAAADGVASAEVAGPGFLNITLSAAAAGELARTIVTAGPAYGTGQGYAGRTINVEFVSANPTGPIHIGGARWAAVGDALSRLLQAGGATVIREYYFNDHGTQIDKFAASLLARARGREVPEDGYGGQYIDDIAAAVTKAEVAAGRPEPASLPGAEAQEIFRREGVKAMFAEIKADLKDFRVDFDVYFHEDSLHSSGAVTRVLAELVEGGSLYESDGAWWLRSSEYGDDKDRVVVKSDGNAAYIAADIAYIRDKRSRGADLLIYLLGADHHGYIARLKAAAAAIGDDPDIVEVLIGQMVTLKRHGAPVKMSKRAGTVVTMDDLTGAIGVDGARYALVRSSMDQVLEIDLDVWTRASNDNPVYYVQYAHARTASVARNAAELGVRREDGFDPSLLSHETETVLLSALGSFPRVLAQAADLREPHRVAHYLEELAGLYHKWYQVRRVKPMGDEEVSDTHRTRLWLNDAVRQVLATGLSLLGVSAPERM